MAQTLTRLLVHAVFSTKRREPLNAANMDSALLAFIGGICKSHESPLLLAGVCDDHVHLLISLSKNMCVADLKMHVKKDSSRWAKSTVPTFRWQDGYAAFSVGESQVAALRTYFAGQRDRHRRMTFQEELRALCRKYNVVLDEEFAWD